MYHMHHKTPYNISFLNYHFSISVFAIICHTYFHCIYHTYIFFHICLVIEISTFFIAQMHKPNAIWPSTPYIYFHTAVNTPYMFSHSFVCLSYIHIFIAHHKIVFISFAQMHKPNAIWHSTPYIFFSYCN